VELRSDELAKLEGYLDLVTAWSERMNLVGSSSSEDLVDRHLLDSFAPATLLGPSKSLVDYGSGSGFPGVPLAVLFPSLVVHLVESRRKRCSFLRHAVRTLSLENVTVWESRGEDWRAPEAGIQVATGRALAADDLARMAARALPPGARLIVMRKQDAARNLEGFTEIETRRYRLPHGERHEVAAYERLP